MFNLDDFLPATVDRDQDDSAPYLQEAINAAFLAGTGVVFEKNIVINSTVIVKCPLVGVGSNIDTGSCIYVGIEDGSPALLIDHDRSKLQDFTIQKKYGTTGNFIGYKINHNYYDVRNIYVYGAVIGHLIDGWIGDLYNAWAYGCSTGFYLVNFSGARAQLFAEGCNIGAIISGSGSTFCGCIEGNTGTGLDIISGTALSVHFYMESNPTHIKATNINSININGNYGGPSENGIVLSNCRSAIVNGNFNCPVKYDNCPDIIFGGELEYVPQSNGFTPSLQGDKPVTNIYNLLQDPYLLNTQVVYNRCSSFVTPDGIVISADGSGQGAPYIEFELPIMSGKLLLGAWIYVPPNFPDNYKPDIRLFTDTQTSNTMVKRWKSDRWCFFCRELEISNPLYLKAQVYINWDWTTTTEKGTNIIINRVFLGINTTPQVASRT